MFSLNRRNVLLFLSPGGLLLVFGLWVSIGDNLYKRIYVKYMFGKKGMFVK